jgi:hypothetical protein
MELEQRAVPSPALNLEKRLVESARSTEGDFGARFMRTQIEIGRAFNGLFGRGGELGLFRQISDRVSDRGERVNVNDIINDVAEIDDEAVRREGIGLVGLLEPGETQSLVVKSGKLRTFALANGGLCLDSNGGEHELRAVFVENGRAYIGKEPASREVTSVMAQYDLSGILSDIKTQGTVTDELQRRLDIAVLLKTLKDPAVVDLPQMKAQFLAARALPQDVQIIDGGVLTAQETTYINEQVKEKTYNVNLTQSKKIIRDYCAPGKGFHEGGDEFFRRDDGTISRMVVMAPGIKDGEMVGISDTGHIWTKKNGEKWVPVAVQRRVGGGTEASGATIADVQGKVVSLVPRGGKVEVAVQQPAKAAIRAPEPAADMGTILAAQEAAKKIRAWERVKEISSGDNPTVELLSSIQDVDVMIEGKLVSKKMIAKTINWQSEEMSDLVNFEQYGPQAYIDEEGNFYFKLAKTADENKDGNKEFHFVDLDPKGKFVVARDYARAAYHGTKLNILNLVASDNNVGKDHGMNWCLMENERVDESDSKREFSWYAISANEAVLDKQTLGVVNADKRDYASTGKPSEATPTVIEIRTGEAKQVVKAGPIDLDVSANTRGAEYVKARASLRANVIGLSDVLFFNDGSPQTVIAPKGRVFKGGGRFSRKTRADITYFASRTQDVPQPGGAPPTKVTVEFVDLGGNYFKWDAAVGAYVWQKKIKFNELTKIWA